MNRAGVILTAEDPHETADDPNAKRTDLGHRQLRTDLITFYKGNGFYYAGPPDIIDLQKPGELPLKLGSVLIRDLGRGP